MTDRKPYPPGFVPLPDHSNLQPPHNVPPRAPTDRELIARAYAIEESVTQGQEKELREGYALALRTALQAPPHWVALLESALRYIEVREAYKGAMTAAEVEAAILANRSTSEIEIGANSCNTLARVDLTAMRDAIAQAKIIVGTL